MEVITLNELCHHGVKGQRLGVRRFQNPDGTLTEAGRKRRNVQSIVNTMSDKDMYYLGYDKKDIPYGRKNYTKDYSEDHLVQRFIAKQGKIPVAFLDLEEWGNDEDGKFLNAVIGTRSGDKYRGKGYASQVVKAGQKWFDEHKEEFKYTDINWGARKENKASQRLAEKHGFKKMSKQYDKDWYDYTYK